MHGIAPDAMQEEVDTYEEEEESIMSVSDRLHQATFVWRKFKKKFRD